jgi:hypothetical protein
VQERLQGLRLFLRVLLEHEILSLSNVFEAFLTNAKMTPFCKDSCSDMLSKFDRSYLLDQD